MEAAGTGAELVLRSRGSLWICRDEDKLAEGQGAAAIELFTAVRGAIVKSRNRSSRTVVGDRYGSLRLIRDSYRLDERLLAQSTSAF